jgi:hypothetical protein
MIARPSVRALTEWRTLLGTIPTRPRSSDLLHAVDGQFEFTFDHLVDLFLRVEMFVNGGAAFEIVVGEGHAGRMKVASIPARQTLNDFEFARIYEWHRSAPGERF